MTNKFSCFLTQKGRWLTATLFLLFSLGIGNMWADVTIPSSTLTLPSTGLGSWTGFICGEGGATSYNNAEDGYVVYMQYAIRMSAANQTWYASVGGTDNIGSGTGTWDSSGIFKGYTYWNIRAEGDSDSKYRLDQFKKEHSGGYHYYRVTNCTGVKIYYKSSKGSTTISLKVFEISGEPGSEIATEVTAAANSASSTSAADGTLANNSTLDKTKEYLIEVHCVEEKYSDKSDNVRFYEIAFYYPPVTDTEAPTLSSSVPANSATDVAVSGTIVLTFSEAIASVDGSKFSLTGATKGTVAIDGTDSKKVNVPYSGATNSATVTLSVAADAVADAAGNKSAALDDIAFTTVAAETPTCPSGVSITGTTAYTVGETIELTATLTEGNGTISYQWYKGSVAAGNEVGTNSNVLTIASCTTSDEGNYYCVASKDACANATSSAYAVTVEAVVACYTFTAPLPAEAVTYAVNDVVAGSDAGGEIKVLGNTIKNTAYGLSFESNSTAKVEVTLGSLMKEGTQISVTVLADYKENNNRGLLLQNGSGTKKADWLWKPATDAIRESHNFTYTVEAGDGLVGSNVFRIARSTNAIITSLTVSNCGAELLALNSAVSVAGKATVTLDKSYVAAGGSATATYSDIDAAYEFDGWEITSGDATIADATVNPAAITMGTTASTITLKLKAASVKYLVHFDSKGGTSVANQEIEAGGHASVPTAPTKFKYTFGGWSETDGGSTPADLASIAITAEKTFYAIWTPKVCPTSGTIYSFVSDGTKAPGSNTYCPASGVKGVVDIATYATVSGGLAQAVHTTTSNNPAQIQTSTSAVKLSHADGYFRALLECPLQEGDTIKFVKTNKVKMAFDSLRTKVVDIASGTGANKDYYIVPAGYAGVDTIMVYYGGSSVNLTALRVIRPAHYDVTFNMHGHGDAVTAQNIIKGGKVSEPATTDITGWDFGGWYKTYVAEPESYSDAWNFANDVVSAAVELHAKWTEHAASTDATLSALSVAGCTLNETFAPATTAYTVDIPFYASMPAVGDVTATKNDENAKTPVVSITGNVITIHCEAESGATLDYTITVSTASAPTTSSSINIEQAVLDNGKTWGFAAALSDAHIAIVDADALDSINESKEARNEPFLGLKFKKATSQFTIVVPASTELNVKFGSINNAAGLKVSVNGSTPAAPSLTDNVYTLAASAGVKEVVFTLDVAEKTVVLKQIMVGETIKSVTLPWKVSFNVGGHADAVSPMVWTGTALTLPGVANVEAGYAFEKWNDGTTDYTAGADYTPASNITLNAVYSMTVEDRLAELEFNGVAIAGFSSDITIYNMTVPYSVALPQITKAVAIDEAGGATATIQATVWNDVYKYYVAQAYVIPAGGTSVDAKFYQVRFTMDPKLGANIFTAELTSPTAATYSGLYADAENSKIALANDGGKYKFAAASNYITIALKDGAFAEGDLLKMTYSANPTQGKLALYPSLSSIDSIVSADAPAANLTLPAGSDAYNVLHIRRTSKNNYNGWVSKVEVLREMDPIITSLKVGDAEATINEGAKTISIEVPFSMEIDALVPTIVAYANGGATVTPAAAQDFTSGPVDYTVTSLYGETTTYSVTITKAVPSSDATLSALSASAGVLSPAFDPAVLSYTVALPYGTADVPTLSATKNHVGAADPVIANAAAFVNRKAVSTVTVTAEDGTTELTYTVTFNVEKFESTIIWDGSTMSAVATSPVSGFTWAVTGMSVDNYNATCGSKAYTKTLKSGGSASSSRNIALNVPEGYFAKFYIVFGTHEDGTERGMFIGTTATKTLDESSVLTLYSSSRTNLTAGTSEMVLGEGTWYINPMASVDFYEISATLMPVGYQRNVTEGRMGTLCLPANVEAGYIYGAEVYTLLYWKYGTSYADCQMVDFEQVDEMQAGYPYLIIPTSDKFGVVYGDETYSGEGVHMANGFTGTINPIAQADNNVLVDKYGVVNNMIQKLGPGCYSPANRAYIDLSLTPSKEEYEASQTPNPAPKKRVSLGHQGTQVATGLDAINVDTEKTEKIMIDGQMFIIRGGHIFDATGRLVK